MYVIMYILKTKGTAKIPDYIQVRDDCFVLLDHFKANVAISFFKKLAYINDAKKVEKQIAELPYGILTKIN